MWAGRSKLYGRRISGCCQSARNARGQLVQIRRRGRLAGAYRGVALAGFVVGRLAARGLARCSDGSRSSQAFPNGSDSVRWVVHDCKRVAKCLGEF